MGTELESYLQDRWQAPDRAGDTLVDATTGEEVAQLGSGGFDLAAALDHGRTVGQRNLRQLTFQQRGQLLKELGRALSDRKDELHELSHATGSTAGTRSASTSSPPRPTRPSTDWWPTTTWRSRPQPGRSSTPTRDEAPDEETS